MKLAPSTERAIRRWGTRAILATVAASALGVAGLFCWGIWVRGQVAVGDDAMNAVRAGMTEAEIAGPLSDAGFERYEPPRFTALYVEPPRGTPAPVVTHEWRRSLDAGIGRVTWVVSLDEDETVVQTHRYD
ncbi:hypothetical protein [Alienimonas chondri]|uniref:DUF2845 domain-containing protein n=1 Tax=Alienimonas chondri TaxID=2681879 RepID=A0ABX1VEC8_9PLAN|nr:hypothetical protein [Alienimonas chondri]NNJ25643.1 hypothetical protein [Alienimonas chondri]